ncbi:cell death abnormality protein 1-like isoform X2 [Leptopilina boulardi]|uniref:cell death abnormality protein 1-like isoform X2 n=1 Tax=Leptopilina boulardi TaxID=63433 RepID=UPI0021F644BD|nr:cell death abnormality protein 1-like isoform X2 [Leptopilina boulardi]
MKVFLFLTFFFFFAEYTCAELSHERTARLSPGAHPCKEDKDCPKFEGVKCVIDKCLCYEGNNTEIVCKVKSGNNPEARNYEDPALDSFIGKSCTNNNDCHYLHAHCNETKHCDCEPDFTNTKDGKYCLKAAKNLQDECKKEEQCTFKFPNATCTNKKCVCRENYHVSASQCWKDVGYGEKCDDPRECWHIYGYCATENNTCVCSGDRVINSRKSMCLDVVKHNERCFETVQCTASLGDADCVQGYCHCARNYHFVPFRQKCIPSKIESSAVTFYISSLLLMTVLGFLLCL